MVKRAHLHPAYSPRLTFRPLVQDYRTHFRTEKIMTLPNLGQLKLDPIHVPSTGETKRLGLPWPRLWSPKPSLFEENGARRQLQLELDAETRKFMYVWDCADGGAGLPNPFKFSKDIEPRILFHSNRKPAYDYNQERTEADWRLDQSVLISDALTRSGFRDIPALDKAVTAMFGTVHFEVDVMGLVDKLGRSACYEIEIKIEYEAFSVFQSTINEDSRMLILLPSVLLVTITRTAQCEGEGGKVPLPHTVVYEERTVQKSTNKNAAGLRNDWRKKAVKDNEAQRKRLEDSTKSLEEQLKKLGG